MIYRFRVILNAKEDVFRDLELRHDQSLEDFHNSITLLSIEVCLVNYAHSKN